MANQQQLSILKQGAYAWNKWREEHPDAPVDLSKADLSDINPVEAFAGMRYPSFPRANLGGISLGKANLKETNFYRADLAGADFSEADLKGAELSETYLKGADLRRADLSGAHLSEADLRGANLTGARLNETDLRGANLSSAHLIGANLNKSYLRGADLLLADLMQADLRGADLSKTYLRTTDLRQADLRGANLTGAIMVGTKIDRAKLSGSSVFAVNICDLGGEFEEQRELVITPYGSAVITVDNIKIAQFLYLILNNQEIRDAIPAVTARSALIVGSFGSPDRTRILEVLRKSLRQYDLLPIVLDLGRSVEKDFTETIKTLAELSYFVIADITNPRSAPLELQATIPDYQVPFVPIIQEGESPLAMMVDLQKNYDWVLDTLEYDSADTLVNVLKPAIIDPAIEKYNDLRLIKARVPKVLSAKGLLES